MSTLTLVQQVRKRVWNYFTYETARSVGLSIPDLQQFALGTLTLDAEAVKHPRASAGGPQVSGATDGLGHVHQVPTSNP